MAAAPSKACLSLQEELTCPVCLELFNDPVLLQCSHSLCYKCYQDIKKAAAGLNCPTCRRHISSVALHSVLRNLPLKNLVSHYKNMRSRDSLRDKVDQSEVINKDEDASGDVSCDFCLGPATRRAEFSCKQCCVCYCQRCLEKYHPSVGELTQHKVKPLDGKKNESKAESCRDHSGKNVTIFCLTCSVPVCHLCIRIDGGKHVSHQIIDRGTAALQHKRKASDIKSDITSWCEKVAKQKSDLSDLKMTIESTYKDATDQINKLQNFFVTGIISRIEKLSQNEIIHFNTTKSALIDKLSKFEGENNVAAQNLASIEKQCESLLNCQNSLLNSMEDLKTLEENSNTWKERVTASLRKMADVVYGGGVSQRIEKFTTAMMEAVRTYLLVPFVTKYHCV